MKKLLLLILGLLFIGTLILILKKGGPEKISSVSTSFYPLYFLTSQIAQDKAEVKNITPAGAEPHEYEPTPQDIAGILKGKLLIVNGAGLEPWAQKLEEELKQKGITIITATEGSPNDPHVWLSPVLSKEIANKIMQGLVKIDPANRSFYEANAKELKQKLDDLDKKYKDGLSACKQKSFVASHQAFSYLAKEYGITQVAISGLSPQEPSPQDLKRVSEFAKDNNVRYIFFETLVSPKLSQTLAKEVGAKTLVLDPIEGISEDDIKAGKNYFTVMEDNLQNLRTALECN